MIYKKKENTGKKYHDIIKQAGKILCITTSIKEKLLQRKVTGRTSSINSDYLWPVGLWTLATASFCLFAISLLSYTYVIKQPNVFRFIFLRKGFCKLRRQHHFLMAYTLNTHKPSTVCTNLVLLSSSTIFMFPHLIVNSFAICLSEPHRGFHGVANPLASRTKPPSFLIQL